MAYRCAGLGARSTARLSHTDLHPGYGETRKEVRYYTDTTARRSCTFEYRHVAALSSRRNIRFAGPNIGLKRRCPAQDTIIGDVLYGSVALGPLTKTLVRATGSPSSSTLMVYCPDVSRGRSTTAIIGRSISSAAVGPASTASSPLDAHSSVSCGLSQWNVSWCVPESDAPPFTRTTKCARGCMDGNPLTCSASKIPRTLSLPSCDRLAASANTAKDMCTPERY